MEAKGALHPLVQGRKPRKVPDAEIRWKDAGVGASVTAGLFTLGEFALGFIWVARAFLSLRGCGLGRRVGHLGLLFRAGALGVRGIHGVFARHFGATIKPDADAVALPKLEAAPVNRRRSADADLDAARAEPGAHRARPAGERVTRTRSTRRGGRSPKLNSSVATRQSASARLFRTPQFG
jgi:hypothetical protein